MKTNFLIPVVAMIFAIGMSFATPGQETDPTQDYILYKGSFVPLGQEIDCIPGDVVCQVRLPNGEIEEVYDAADPNSQKPGNGEIKDL